MDRRVRALRRQADGGGARIKEGAVSQPGKVSEAAPKLALLSFPRSSKGRTPAVTSEAIQVRILAGEPRINWAKVFSVGLSINITNCRQKRYWCKALP